MMAVNGLWGHEGHSEDTGRISELSIEKNRFSIGTDMSVQVIALSMTVKTDMIAVIERVVRGIKISVSVHSYQGA